MNTRPPAAVSVEEATALANGWRLLAQGQADQASAEAASIMDRFSRSGAALAFAVETDILRTGAASALGRYERWLGARTLEEPAVLQRIARAVLHEELARQQNPVARAEAWRGLTDDGEPTPAPFGSVAALGGATADVRALAALGDERAVRALIAEMPADSAGRVRSLDALGASSSPLAVKPILPLLRDPRTEVRAAAADALGKIGGPDAVSAMKPLVSDRSVLVRAKAAGALYRLGDTTGLPVLDSLASDEMPSMQLLAAEGMASHQDAAWTSLVRNLAGNQEPEIRAWAARLIASQDPALAKSVLDALLLDPNPAIRDLAAIDYGDIVAACDLATLRRLLRQSNSLTRVRAASRILAVMR